MKSRYSKIALTESYIIAVGSLSKKNTPHQKRLQGSA